jgi:hypothetical protein
MGLCRWLGLAFLHVLVVLEEVPRLDDPLVVVVAGVPSDEIAVLCREVAAGRLDDLATFRCCPYLDVPALLCLQPDMLHAVLRGKGSTYRTSTEPRRQVSRLPTTFRESLKKKYRLRSTAVLQAN